MVCVYCAGKTKVINSRHQLRNNQIWRRRQCLQCRTIFTSHEAADLTSTLQVEVRGLPQPFLADLLFTEILLALQDRKDCYTASREVTATVIRNLLKLPQKPLFKPSDISRTSAEVLKRFNRRAWLRYVAEHPSLQI